VVLDDLKACEATLRVAEQDFISGAQLWGQHQHGGGLRYFTYGLNKLAKAAGDCGLNQEIKYLAQEANVLGLGNVTRSGLGVSVLVHGKDMYREVHAAFQSFETGDYRTAGSDLQKVIADLYQWTTGNLCNTDACYVVNGITQYTADLSKDIKSCGHDFVTMFDDFKDAFHQLEAKNVTATFKGFTHNIGAIVKAVGDIGKGFSSLADSVSDCHMEELTTVLAALGDKFSSKPFVAVIEEILKIIVKGVPVEREIAAALEDFGANNWPGFGYNLIKVMKTLLVSEKSEQLTQTEAIVI